MKFLLVHLSDLHIKNHNTVQLLNKQKIIDAVKNLEYQLDAAFVLVTGDIAYDGGEDQILEGFTFLSETKELLNKNLFHNHKTVPTYLIPVPGNHDCWLPDTDAARNILLGGIVKDEKVANEDSIIRQCTSAQKSFFDGIDSYAKEGLNKVSPVYYEYNIKIGSECVTFKCLNTAWMSKIYEEQGHIIYPLEKLENIDETKNNETLIITLLHHPYNWLNADNARELKKKLGRISDIIFTGHEHDSAMTQTISSRSEKNTYIEGGVLQNNNSILSSNFNAVIIDTSIKKQKYINLGWSRDGLYVQTDMSVFEEGSDTTLAWHEYQAHNLRFQEQFSVNRKTLEFLEDTGASFSDKNDGMKLSDIYVFPDLKSIPTVPNKNQTTISGDDIDEFLKDHLYVLIVGDYQSGKTSLCKNLFLKLSKIGEVPLFIDGNDSVKSNNDSFTGDIFIKQYERRLLEEYKQLNRTKRVVIIDNYHKLQLNKEKKKDFIAWLCDFAGRVILIGDELSIGIQDISNPDYLSGGRMKFEYYSIQQFGHLRRDVLIKKWLIRKADSDNPVELARRIESASKILNTLMGRNYVLAYPIYIVSILFASDAMTQIDLSASTHAYFYELIIKIVIARGRTGLEYNIAASYLSFVAYKMFKKRTKKLTEDEYKIIHKAFEEKYEINRSFEKMKNQLLEQHIITESDGEYKFKQSFIYYYFVASFLRDNLSKDDSIKTDIKNICNALYVEEFANILLFLAHLCKDIFIVNELIDKSEQLFTELQPAKLDGDIDFINNLNNSIKDLTIEEKDKETVRQELLKRRDREDNEEVLINLEEPVKEEDYIKNPLLQLTASLKTIEILGQILKNFPASIDADDKKKMAQSCYNTGLRTLTFAFEILKRNEQELLKDFIGIIHEKNPNLNLEEIKQQARESLVWMSEVFAFGLIKRVSYSVGTPDLFITYDKIVQETPWPSVQLIDCALSIDQANHFPDEKILNLSKALSKKWFPHEILRNLVIQHLYLFEVPPERKQKVCKKLEINFTILRASFDPKRKLIDSKSK